MLPLSSVSRAAPALSFICAPAYQFRQWYVFSYPATARGRVWQDLRTIASVWFRGEGERGAHRASDRQPDEFVRPFQKSNVSGIDFLIRGPRKGVCQSARLKGVGGSGPARRRSQAHVAR